MYIERVRNYITQLHKTNPKEFNLFLDKLIIVLDRDLDIRKKRKDVTKIVKNFMKEDPKYPSGKYYEAYLLAIDEMSYNGAKNVLDGGKIKSPHTWRELLILTTSKETLPEYIAHHFTDQDILNEVEVLINSSILYCASETKKEFREKLHDFNRFLAIKKT
ncbi:hypothetical protein [Virgibacillus sp. DJP39]|uniref:hypothetical protein n=1 Tax=Virgibacillus sp. DJP39 TaxID=3409790 RepID=UPI003BB4FC07